MKRSIFVALFCLAASALNMQAQTSKPEQSAANTTTAATEEKKLPMSTPVAVAGDWVITLGDMESRISQAMPQFRPRFATAEGRRLLLNSMIDSRLLYEEAVHRGLDKDPVLQDRLRSFSEQLYGAELSRRIMQDVMVTEEEAKAYFDAHPEEFTTPEQVRARHILVKTEEEAGQVLKQLQQGTKFEELAKTKSTDVRTAPTGGELGWFRRGVMAPEFEKAAFSLETGALSGIISTSFGFHILQVEEKRAAQLNPFELEKIRILSQLKGARQREVYETFKQKLRADAKVVIREDLLQPQSVVVPESTSQTPQPAAVKP